MKVSKLMDSKKLNGVIITDEYNMEYLSSFRGRTGCLFYLDDKKYIITDSRYTEMASMEAKDFECIDVGRIGYSETIKKLILSNVTEIDIKSDKTSIKIGFENEHISYLQYKAFVDKLGDLCELVELDASINNLRMVKNDYEIDCIAKAEAIGDAAFKHILDYIEEGMSEKDVALELEYFMKKNGASALSFDTIAASGTNSSMPHAMPSDKKISKGEFITMDFGCVYNEYCSDMTRTIYMGEDISEEELKVYNVVLEAQTRAMEMIKPGVKCSDVDKCARDIIAKAGYGEYFGHGLGHGVGLFIHEEPRFSMKCDEILQPGMVITVEPGIYLPGKFGVRIEDLVVVTEEGYKNLTNSPKELIKM